MQYCALKYMPYLYILYIQYIIQLRRRYYILPIKLKLTHDLWRLSSPWPKLSDNLFHENSLFNMFVISNAVLFAVNILTMHQRLLYRALGESYVCYSQWRTGSPSNHPELFIAARMHEYHSWRTLTCRYLWIPIWITVQNLYITHAPATQDYE